MIENETQFITTLERLGGLLDGLEDLQRTVLPKSATLYGIASESVLEDIRRLRNELIAYLGQHRIAG
jgi:hypothetical protein